MKHERWNQLIGDTKVIRDMHTHTCKVLKVDNSIKAVLTRADQN